MSHSAITVENLSKAYRIGVQTERADSFVGAMQNVAAAPFRNWNRLRKLNTYGDHADAEDLHWALRDVSFEVPEGEVLGVIGRNGAGKSTLLKILSRITEPTRGRATIRGRVSSLLEVGTGFHQELSGRENIYLNGTILGMRKREIDRKLDQIIDFSGVEKFLDTPIKRYSSGMKVRLAFAVAAHLEPEILIIDEVLAVGDAEFQEKCMGKMHDVATGGRTVLFVSHNMTAIGQLCDKAILLAGGKVVFSGGVHQAIEVYMSKRSAVAAARNFDTGTPRVGSGEARFQQIMLANSHGVETCTFSMGEGLRIHLEFSNRFPLDQVAIAMGVYDGRHERVALFNSYDASRFIMHLPTPERARVQVDVPRLNLVAGDYSIHLMLQQLPTRSAIDHVVDAIGFTVQPTDIFGTGSVPSGGARVFFESKWEIIGPDDIGIQEHCAVRQHGK